LQLSSSSVAHKIQSIENIREMNDDENHAICVKSQSVQTAGCAAGCTPKKKKKLATQLAHNLAVGRSFRLTILAISGQVEMFIQIPNFQSC